MPINIICNKLGHGKTLFLVVISMLYALKGKKIYSNFSMEFTDVLVQNKEMLLKMSEGLFAWDDAYADADSRHPKENEVSNLMCRMSRKRGIDIWMTAVRVMNMDINIRRNIEFVFMPEIFCHKISDNLIPFKMNVHKFAYDSEKKEGEDLNLLFSFQVPFPVLFMAMTRYNTGEEIYPLK